MDMFSGIFGLLPKGKGKKNNSSFIDSSILNERTYIQYFNRIFELGISSVKYENLPEQGNIDPRFLEVTLFTEGQAVLFKDEVLDQYLGLQVIANGPFNVYRIPVNRVAYAENGYRYDGLNPDNSVIIYNNMIRTNSLNDVQMFAYRLYNLDRAIDVNVNAQKTPVLIKTSVNDRLTMKNVYSQYDGNQPVIYGDKGLDPNSISVLKTDAPYVADKLYDLKVQIWNEVLTYFGIPNISVQKKERLLKDEVLRGQGGVLASRKSRINARQQAIEEFNKMFGTEITVDYDEGVEETANSDYLIDDYNENISLEKESV